MAFVPAVSFFDFMLAGKPGTAGIRTMTLKFSLLRAARRMRSKRALPIWFFMGSCLSPVAVTTS